MPVEPVPTRAAGPSGRRAILSAVAPVAALGLVVIAALVGASPDLPTAERPALQPSSRVERTPIAPRLPGMDLSIAPRVAFRLPVRTVDATLDAREAGELGDGLVAVAAYLAVDPRIRDCAVETGVAERDLFCRRLVRLSTRFASATPEASGGGPVPAKPGRSLRAHVLPGTPLPEELAALVGHDGDPYPWPIGSIVIGRFGDPRAGACHPARAQCGDPFVLERVAWIDGRWMDRPTVRDPVIPTSQGAMSSDLTRLLTSRESDRGEVILSEALLTLERLGDVDPAAAAALSDEAGRRLWYVRSIGRSAVDRNERPIWPVAWVVLDVESGLVLATGEPG